jgi:hypothetical protein
MMTDFRISQRFFDNEHEAVVEWTVMTGFCEERLVLWDRKTKALPL